MLQQDKPDDYLIATGRSTSVEDMYKIAFKCVGLNAEDHVVIDKRVLSSCRGRLSSRQSREGQGHTRMAGKDLT